ncbi:MAG: hypothetical protein U1A72_19890 [Sulfuritalea sp.]|nr:hypothetical protein [Sulfuritalea sp.]
MSKLCPRCRLPLAVLGRVIAVTSDDGNLSGVIGICRRCANEEQRLPHAVHMRRMQPALERALADPAHFYCTIYADINAAVLAVSLLALPDFTTRTLAALGWLSGD